MYACTFCLRKSWFWKCWWNWQEVEFFFKTKCSRISFCFHIITVTIYVLCYCLDQCFSTSVPRRISVPQVFLCVPPNLKQKLPYIHNFGLFLHLGVTLNLFSKFVCRKLKMVENHWFKMTAICTFIWICPRRNEKVKRNFCFKLRCFLPLFTKQNAMKKFEEIYHVWPNLIRKK